MFPPDVVKCVGKSNIIEVAFTPPQKQQLNLEDCNNTSISKYSSSQYHVLIKKLIKYSIEQYQVYSNNMVDATFLVESQGKA
jgi:hypothetical protein